MNNKIDERKYWSVIQKKKTIQNELDKIKNSLNYKGIIKNNYLNGIVSRIDKKKGNVWIGNNIYFNKKYSFSDNIDFNQIKEGDFLEFANIEPIDPSKRKGQAFIIRKIDIFSFNSGNDNSNILDIDLDINMPQNYKNIDNESDSGNSTQSNELLSIPNKKTIKKKKNPVNNKKPCPFCNTNTMREKKEKMLGHLGALENNNVKYPCDGLRKKYKKEFKDLNGTQKAEIFRMVDELYSNPETNIILNLYSNSIDNENINVNVNDNNNNVNEENISLGINLEESKKINAIRNVGELF